MMDSPQRPALTLLPDPLYHSPELWDGEVLYLPAPTGRSELVLAAQAYWERQRKGGRLPARHDIDPLAMGPQLLPYLSLVTIEPAPFRVQYRLVGTETTRFYGAEMRGRWVDELSDVWPAQDITDTHETYRRIVAEATPQFGLSLIEWQGRSDNIFEFARFPISDDGTTITHCLGLDDFTMIEPARGRAV